MNRISSKLLDFAGRLIAHEAKNKRKSDEGRPAIYLVTERLRPHLASLMGNAGFHALFARSLALTKAQLPWMRPVQVDSGGALAGLDELEAQVGAEEFAGGSITLLAQLLGLLTAFVGENLTLRLVGEVWPKVALNELDSGNGDKK